MAYEHEFQELERIVRGMQDTADELQRSAREQSVELARWREEMAGADDDRAGRARRGEMGPDWVRLQQRVDLGQTSVEAIMSGQDESREAERVRAQSQRGADAVRAKMEDDLQEEDDPTVAAVRDQVEHIREMLREIRDIPPPRV